MNSKGGIVKYYDSDLALVQTVSKRDLLHGLGVVKEDYETCKLMEGYYAIRYLGEDLHVSGVTPDLQHR